MSGRGERGQAAVELVALAPLVGALVVAFVLGLRAHRAGEAAGLAAHAGAVAALVGRDPVAAARAAAPDVELSRVTVVRDGRRITVQVRAAGAPALVRAFDAERTVTLPAKVSPWSTPRPSEAVR